MDIFSEEQLLSGLIDCTSVGSIFELQLSADSNGYTVKVYESNVIVYRMCWDNYESAKEDYIRSINDI